MKLKFPPSIRFRSFVLQFFPFLNTRLKIREEMFNSYYLTSPSWTFFHSECACFWFPKCILHHSILASSVTGGRIKLKW
jgi:hypothetical protein